MAEVIKKATRDGYGNALVELAEKYDNLIVMDADLAAATKTGVFKKAYPDQFFDAGIAECNLIGVAAGLATTGHLVFASSFAMFAAQYDRLSTCQCKDRCDARRHLRGRRWREPSVLRGYCPDAHDPGHGHHQPGG